MTNWPFNKSNELLKYFEESQIIPAEVDFNSTEIKEVCEWFTTPPNFTTLRVNTFKTDVDNVIDLINCQLQKQAVDRNDVNVPIVVKDQVLKDCVVVTRWSVNEDLHQRNLENNFEVIVDVPCGVALLRGANVFAPGVIAMSPGVKEGNLVKVYADVSKKCLKGFLKHYHDPLKKFIGYGEAKMTRKTLFESNGLSFGIAVEMKETVSGVPSFEYNPEFGLLQNYPSILCSHVLNPQQDDLVLDMCAAPGNKTSHIASLMKGLGKIIALDKTGNKVKRIKDNCNKQQLHNVYAFAYDSTKAVREEIDCNRMSLEDILTKGPPFNENTFDRILLDVPCSALGQRPQFRNCVVIKQLNSYPSLQKRLLKTAVKLLKPNGTLVYSTCTLSVQENEKIISWALNEFPELRLVSADPIMGSPGLLNCGLTEEQCYLVQKFCPQMSKKTTISSSYHADTVGFFIAKFIKVKR